MLLEAATLLLADEVAGALNSEDEVGLTAREETGAVLEEVSAGVGAVLTGALATLLAEFDLATSWKSSTPF